MGVLRRGLCVATHKSSTNTRSRNAQRNSLGASDVPSSTKSGDYVSFVHFGPVCRACHRWVGFWLGFRWGVICAEETQRISQYINVKLFKKPVIIIIKGQPIKDELTHSPLLAAA
jgi:hypothetical protein